MKYTAKYVAGSKESHDIHLKIVAEWLITQEIDFSYKVISGIGRKIVIYDITESQKTKFKRDLSQFDITLEELWL